MGRPTCMRWAPLAVVAFAAVACTKKGESSPRVAETRAEACERITAELQRTAQIASGVMINALSDDPAAARESARGAGAEVAAMAAQMNEDCLSWPEETVKCLGQPLYAARHSEACEAAMATAMGEPPPPSDVPDGPAPKFTYTFQGTPTTLRLRDDGLVVARFSDYESGEGDEEGTWYRALVGVKDGAELWSHEGDFDPNVVVLDRETHLVVSDGELRAIDPATGTTRWTWRPPTDAIEDFDPEWDSPPRVAVVAIEGDHILVGDADARWWTVAVGGTKADNVGVLSEETLDADARLFIAPDGTRWLWESYQLRGFDAQWSTKTYLRAHDFLGDVQVRDGEVVALMDDEVLVIDPTKCRAPQRVAPTQWPHPGEIFAADLDECSDCQPAPAGCVKWQQYVADVSNEPVGLLPDGGVVVNDGIHTIALRDGAPAWKAATAAGGRPAVGADVYALMPGGDESSAKLWALDPASGAHRWGRELSAGAEGWLYSTDEVHLLTAGTWIVAGYGPKISAFSRD